MRRRGTDTPSESQVIETIDQNQRESDDQFEELGKDTQDAETTRQTVDDLDLTATLETAEAVEQELQSAQDTIEQQFNEDGEKLDQVQDESQEYEGELHERGDGVDSDLAKVSDASDQLHNDAARNEYVQVKETLIRGKEFMDDQERRARDAREDSERKQQVMKDRLRAAQGA